MVTPAPPSTPRQLAEACAAAISRATTSTFSSKVTPASGAAARALPPPESRISAGAGGPALQASRAAPAWREPAPGRG